MLTRADGLLLRVNRPFARLVDVPAEEIVQKGLSVYDLMTEESTVNFVEKVSVLASHRSLESIYSVLSLVCGGIVNEDRSLQGQVRRCLLSLKLLYDQNRLPCVFVVSMLPVDGPAFCDQQPKLEER